MAAVRPRARSRRRVQHAPFDATVAERARRDLRRFVREAWDAVEPGTPYQHGWHIDAICEHLQAVSSGEILRLIINVPPRHSKSLSVAVFWPAWVWIERPEVEWVFASYARELASLHSMDCRRLIESAWYQERWGSRFSLVEDENRKMRFENDRGGVRHATSVGGTVTGMGGHVRVYDDPHKVNEVESEEQRRKVAEWRDKTMSSRTAGDPEKAAEVVIMQRLHEGDLTGHLIERGGFEHLCLPARYEPAHPFTWPDDPRSEEGDLLWPERFTAPVIEQAKLDLGSYGFAGQYQQRPSPAEGGILRREWWQRYQSPPPFEEIVQSWDCAFKDLDDSDYVVGQAWGRDGPNRFLIAQIRARISFTDTLQAVRDLDAFCSGRWPEKRSAVLVEDKANGSAVIDVLRREISGLLPIEPEGGKESRAHAVSPLIEAGNVHVPAAEFIPAPPGHEATSTQDYIEEAAGFPNALHDDQVDAMTQALLRMKGSRKRDPASGPPAGRAPMR